MNGRPVGPYAERRRRRRRRSLRPASSRTRRGRPPDRRSAPPGGGCRPSRGRERRRRKRLPWKSRASSRRWRGRRRSHDGAVGALAAPRATVLRISERVHRAVGGSDEVALAVRGCGDTDDRVLPAARDRRASRRRAGPRTTWRPRRRTRSRLPAAASSRAHSGVVAMETTSVGRTLWFRPPQYGEVAEVEERAVTRSREREAAGLAARLGSTRFAAPRAGRRSRCDPRSPSTRAMPAGS